MDNTQQPQSQAPKDQNVLSFMLQMVQERYGPTATPEFLTQESNRLYDLFGDNLVGYFEPMLTEEQKQQFDQMVQQNVAQDQLLQFLITAIPNLEQQIMTVLMQFKSDYIAAKFQVRGGGPPTPGAVRGEITKLEGQKREARKSADGMQADLIKAEQQKASYIAARREAVSKVAEYTAALQQIPPDHPQYEKVKAALENAKSTIANVDKGLPQLQKGIDARRKQIRALRERNSQIQGAIGQRRAMLMKLAAQQAQKKKQQAQQKGKSRKSESGKNKG